MKNYIKIISISFLLLSTFYTHGAPNIESYGRLEQISDMSISPNGEIMAYRRTDSDDMDFVVVFSLKEKKLINALNVNSINPQGHYFVNNDYIVLVVEKRLNTIGYEEFNASSIFSFDFKNNKVEQLVKLGEKTSGNKNVTVGQTGLGSVVGKSPDGSVLYIPAFVSDDSFDVDPDYSLLAVKTSGKGRPNIVSKGTGMVRDYFMDNNDNIIAREKLNNSSNEHSLEVFKKGRWKKIYSYKSKSLTHSFIGLNDDYSALIFSRSDDDEGYLKISLSDGQVEPLGQLKSGESSSGLIKNAKGAIVGLKYSGFSPDYKLFDKKLDQRIQEIVSRYKGNSVYIADWSKDWKHIIVRVEGTLHVGDYYLFSEGKPPEKLLTSRLDIASEDINPIATIKLTARDGLSIPTILTLPKASMNNLKNLPAVLMPHGGPASNDQIGFDYSAQALASRGYLVIQPQFRGSTGFGKEHHEAGFGEWGKAMQDDLTDSVKSLIKKGYVDANNVCIVGASYGGYAALAGAAFTPDLFKCAVSIAGVSHLPRMLLADKRRYGSRSWLLDYWNENILAGDYDKKKLQEASPYFSADKIKIPVLLIHGEDDTIVEYEQSRLMYKAIKKAKGNTRLVKLKKDDHYLQNSATRIQAVTEMVSFVDKHIGKN